MTQLDSEMGGVCLRKGLRRIAAMVSVLIFGVLVISPAGAAAAQRPIARPHGKPPFGHSYRAVCGPPARGHARCFALVITTSSARAAPALVSAIPAGYGPADLQNAYKLSSLSSTGGDTQTVAIVDAYDDAAAESDLATYRSTYGLSPCTTANGCFRKVNQTGGGTPPAPDSGWAEEISLDLDMVSAIAPNAHILLVESNDSGPLNMGEAVNEAATLGATQISNSYGADEVFEASYASYYNHPGIAVTASTGDNGYGCNQYWQPCAPASMSTVEAVGGTSLSSISPRTESAWAGAGSGCSEQFAKPSWQQDLDCSMRSAADVSAVADPLTGVAVYDSGAPIGGWAIFGGTSASSPIIAAFDALIGPSAASAQWAYQHTNAFNDVITGSNNLPGSPCSDYLCNAGLGYDGPTGLGTPNGQAIAPLCSAGPTITTNPSNQTVTALAGASFTAAASNPAGCNTLSVQWQVSTNGGASWSNDSTDSGNTTNTLSINPTSTAQSGYQYRAAFTNEHGATDSSAATLTVNAPPPSPPSATAAPHVSGAALVGATLSVSTGVWTGAPDSYDYAWFDCPSASGACSQVSAGAASYVTGTGDANGQVYAEVRAHNTGGWSGFARSDNSITPLSGRPGGGGHPGTLSVGQVTVSGMSASVPLRCSGDTSCPATVSLTVTETLNSGKLIAVSAARLTRKVVVLARVSLMLGASQSKTVKATLNAAGKRLVPKHGHMKVKLTVTQSGRTMSVKTLTFARH